AWQALVTMAERFDTLPEHASNSALLTQIHQQGRRQFLQWLGIFVSSAGLGYGINKTDLIQQTLADYSTSVGETRTIQLADGSELKLNTNTAIDVIFNGKDRLIKLHQGELFITTGHAASFRGQPFQVATRQGVIEALGTRFNVLQQEDITTVGVIEDTVLVHTQHQRIPLQAGQQLRFSDKHIDSTLALEPSKTSWIQRKLVAEQMKLSQFLTELSRYRRGILRCDEAVADLRISGVFPLDNTDKAIQQMAQALPVTLHTRTRYWLTVVANKE
ncbi:hypothetical protein LCGC14_2574280, partial [marine sediment metagenome]